jgi:hypothetical protein
MGEEVKITVIATGFEREGLPTIERKRSAGDPVAASAPSAQMEIPQPEPMHAGAAEEPVPEAEPEPLTMAATASAPAPPPAPAFDDLDVPAILRRDRRFVQ